MGAGREERGKRKEEGTRDMRDERKRKRGEMREAGSENIYEQGKRREAR